MSDTATPPATSPATPPTAPATTQPPGYFNQAQLQDIQDAEDILAPASDPARAALFAKRDITTAYLAGLAAAVAEARQKTFLTGQDQDLKKTATLNATDSERDLITVLQGIQAAARQKHQMLAEDDDPTTNFPTDGYLIGQRLNKNRATLLQNAATLQSKAAADDLPGYKTPEDLAAIQTAIDAYKNSTATQAERDLEAEADRIARDKLVRKINSRRAAIQHAADAIWPYTNHDNDPIRKLFGLPKDRPFVG